MFGGEVRSLTTKDTSCARIYGGLMLWSPAPVEALGDSHITILGGVFDCDVIAEDNGHIMMAGGTFGGDWSDCEICAGGL